MFLVSTKGPIYQTMLQPMREDICAWPYMILSNLDLDWSMDGYSSHLSKIEMENWLHVWSGQNTVIELESPTYVVGYVPGNCM